MISTACTPLRRTAAPVALLLTLVLTLTLGVAVHAAQGPYTSLVESTDGFMMDTDVRWPDDPPPIGGWPVVFFAHGAGGDKTTSSGNATTYANDGYVTLTWTSRDTAPQPFPSVLAGDLAVLKSWLVNEFQDEANVVAPVDPARFGITGSSLGGYTSWSAGLLTDLFAVIVPNNWGFHFFEEGLTWNGSIDRRTAGPLAWTLPAPYDAAGLQAAADAVFDSALSAFPAVDIPVMTQMAFLDARSGGTYSLRDFQALTGAPARFLYLGTGGHGTPETDEAFRGQLRTRWFARFLKGALNGIDTEPRIRIALLGTNERLEYDAWPPADTETATLWLRDGGTLLSSPPSGTETPDSIVNDPGTATWTNMGPSYNPNTIRNRVSKDTVAWQSAPLSGDVLMIGQPQIRLELTGTGSRYQVNVHLYDQEDGEDPLLLAFGTATVATSPTVVDVPLSLTARRVPAGHRLRIEITNRDDQDLDYTNGFDPSSDILRYIPFFEGSVTTVFHDAARPSSLTLPLVGGGTLPLPGVACAPAALAGCKLPSVAGASPLTVKNQEPDERDSFSWKWSKGSTTLFTELGDPITEDGYAFCLYDGSPAGTLLLATRAPAGGLCGTRPCWSRLGSETAPKGYKYADRDDTPDGLEKVRVQAGDAPRAKASVKGGGVNLSASGTFPALPLPLPLVAQLQTSDGCFEVVYGTAKVNDAEVFKAK